MSFYLWDKAGVSYPELIEKMVALAEQAHKEKEQNNFAFRSDILKAVSLGGSKGKLKTGKL